MKAATSTTRNKSSNNDDEESHEEINDDDSNSVEAGAASSNAKGISKRNGKATSTGAAASGKHLFNIIQNMGFYFR